MSDELVDKVKQLKHLQDAYSQVRTAYRSVTAAEEAGCDVGDEMLSELREKRNALGSSVLCLKDEVEKLRKEQEESEEQTDEEANEDRGIDRGSDFPDFGAIQ